MRKTTVAAVAALVAAGALAGCSGDQPGPGASGGTGTGATQPVTITFAHWGNNQEADTIKAMVAAFEDAHPEITVEVQWIQSDYEQRLQTAIAGGAAPTVAQISNTSLAGFASVFRPVDLDPDAYASENTAASMLIDGEYRAVPFVVKPKVMAVNTHVFDDAGVTPPPADEPISTDEFAALAQSVTSGEPPDKIYGSARLWYKGWLTAEGGTYYDATGTECTLDTPIAIKTAEDVIAAQAPDGYAPTQLDAEGQDMFDWLSIGRLAMQPDFGPWDIAKLTALEDPGLVLVPVPGDGSPLEFNGLGIATSATDDEAAAAEVFATFMGTDPAAQSLLTTAESSLGVPVVEPAFQAFLDAAPDLNLQAFLDAVDQSQVLPTVAKDPQIGSAFDDLVYSRTALGAGNEDPAVVFADVDAACQKIIDGK